MFYHLCHSFREASGLSNPRSLARIWRCEIRERLRGGAKYVVPFVDTRFRLQEPSDGWTVQASYKSARPLGNSADRIVQAVAIVSRHGQAASWRDQESRSRMFNNVRSCVSKHPWEFGSLFRTPSKEGLVCEQTLRLDPGFEGDVSNCDVSTSYTLPAFKQLLFTSIHYTRCGNLWLKPGFLLAVSIHKWTGKLFESVRLLSPWLLSSRLGSMGDRYELRPVSCNISSFAKIAVDYVVLPRYWKAVTLVWRLWKYASTAVTALLI
jgi:hypothetical protein